ncbi:ankyrin repeat domain-containing protein 53 isoform X2 [Pristis pectinata]|uniref:ankyrin repeat domain-containing protein 53 isoform X2 n=1 Tax=Pristis pectinata TaxID=685728 RepID=UPI00223E7D2C|nr:ankyrin repeat domain-containing protein 53 isoform X2 [Pristis pectinata]
MKRGWAKKWNREEILRDELIAATIGDVDWLRLSLNKAKGKVAVDRNTVDGQSPLHQAAEVGLLDCIITLVEAGANVKAKDKKGQMPLDLAKIWGHRACVRYLTDLVWKANGREFLQEMQKLQKLKLVLLSDEHRLYNIQQEEQDRLTKEQYALWLERKQLPDTVRVSSSFYRPRTTFTEDMLRQLREAVSANETAGTGKVLRFTKPKAPCQSGAGRKEGWVASKPVSETLACATPAKGKAAVCQRRSAWNVSNKSASLPVPSGPPEAEEDTFDLNILIQQHDFGPFYQLEMNRARQPELRAKADPRITRPLPNLPLHVLQRELFPGSISHRIKMPEEFKAVHVFNIPRKRASDRSKAMHLSEWLELGVPFSPSASSSTTTTTTKHSQRTPQSLGKPCSLQSAATNHSLIEDSAPVSREPSPITRADSPREHCKP